MLAGSTSQGLGTTFDVVSNFLFGTDDPKKHDTAFNSTSVNPWHDFEASNLGSTSALIIGIILTVLGSCQMAFGNLLMKLGLKAESLRPWRAVGSACFQPRWWAGLMIYFLGAFLHVAALAFAPASVLAPMNSIGLVANAIVAATMLSEPFTKKDTIGTIGTISGVTICAFASIIPHDTAEVVLGLDCWTDPWYLSFLAANLIIAIGIFSFVICDETGSSSEKTLNNTSNIEGTIVEFAPCNLTPISLQDHNKQMVDIDHEEGIEFRVQESISRKHERNEYILIPPVEVEALEEFNDRIRLMDVTNDPTIMDRRSSKFLTNHSTSKTKSVWVESKSPHVPLLYGVLAGVIGSHSVLQFKELVVWFQVSFVNQSVLHLPYPYICLMLCSFSIIMQLHFLNCGLVRGVATHVVPIYYVFWTLFSTLGGFIKFREFSGFLPGQVVLFCFGIAVTLTFVGYMATREVENIRDEVDKMIVGTDRELRTGKRSSNLRYLRGGLPLSIGYNIISAGNISGRMTRRTRSQHEYSMINVKRKPANESRFDDQFERLPFVWTASV